MRLRPSGRQGPVATSLQSFRDYQMTEAWTWEHLALTRARPMAGPPDLMAEVEAFRRHVLADKGGADRVVPDVAEMRARLQAAKPPGPGWETKNGPGRLMDIELLSQTCALRTGDPARTTEAQLAAGRRAGLLDATQEAALLKGYRLMWRLHAAKRLLGDRTPDPAALGQGACAFLLRETDCPAQDDLTAALEAAVARAADIIAGQIAPAEGNADATG